MSSKTILIVEDEPLIAMDIQNQLKLVDYNFSYVAHSKDEALTTLKTHQVDLAILDINLGNHDSEGIELAEYIDQSIGIPFIFLTSYANKEILNKAKQTRPMAYIVKPFTTKDLFSSIEIAFYNHAQMLQPKQLSLLEINRKLPIELTEREFHILQDIFEGIPNKNMAQKHFVSLNTIKTHIKHLYEKLDVHSRSDTINYIKNLFT